MIEPSTSFKDTRQRFFFERSPIRGDVLLIEDVLQEALSHRDYPIAIRKLLGEMLVAASLFASSLKMSGRLSIQMQGTGVLNWAMAECNHLGQMRALAKWQPDPAWQTLDTADDAFAQLDPPVKTPHKGVLFINMEPETSAIAPAEPQKNKRYQSVVERVSHSLADCLSHYQTQSVQVATLLKLTSSSSVAGGIMLQKLPEPADDPEHGFKAVHTSQDGDLWTRVHMLCQTLSNDELLNLPAQDILYRLFHEEQVVLPAPHNLEFGCTCSHERCLLALKQLGRAGVQAAFEATAQNEDDIEKTNCHQTAQLNELNMGCDFCGQSYTVSKAEALGLFEIPS